MTPRKIPLLTAALVAILGSLAVSLFYSAVTTSEEQVRRFTTPGPQGDEEDTRPREEGIGETAERERRIVSAAKPAVTALDLRGKPCVAASTEVLIEGSIVVTGFDGVENSLESGTMTLVVWTDHSLHHEPVTVADGRWCAAVAKNAEISFTNIVLGGRRAVPERNEHVPLPPSCHLNLRVRWPRESWLRVRSADTGQDLMGIELVWKPELDSNAPEHPGRYRIDQVLVSAASSPIDLGRAVAGKNISSRPLLFARAKGHAWGRIEIDLDAGGERILDIVAAGALDVSLVGVVPRDACLRLRNQDGPVLELDLHGQRRVQLTSLRPGASRMSVEVGNSFDNSVALGSTSVEVVAGCIIPVCIEIDSFPEIEWGHLNVLLVIDPAWGEAAPIMTIRSIGIPGHDIRERLPQNLHPMANTVNTWAFDAGWVPYGTYEIEVFPPLFRFSREISASTGTLRLEVPGPAVAAVRVVDSKGVEVDGVETLYWTPLRSSTISDGRVEAVMRDPMTDRFEIRAPIGEIFILLTNEELRGTRNYKLEPGRHEIDLVVRRLVGFTLVFRDGDTVLPWSGEITVHDAEGQGTEVSMNGTRIIVAGPGLYRFSVSPMDGFEQVPQQEVLVPERGFVEHIIELIRTH